MQEEYLEQVAVSNYLSYKYPSVLWTASAGGMRVSMGTAIKMKRAGYSKGCPDILIFEPRGEYHGLFIEMKRSHGPVKVSDEQKEWIDNLRARNYFAVVARGYDEARIYIDNYLILGKN